MLNLITSNLPKFNKKINLDLPLVGEIRKIIPNLINNFSNEELILLCIKTTGRRILNNRKVEEIIELINGRRHRTYFAIKKTNKIHIKFGWHKIKKLSESEKIFIKNNWHLEFFENEGKCLIEKSGGIIWPESIIYKYINLIQ